jgi:hypothetical protein
MYMLFTAVMCAKPLRHRNVNIKRLLHDIFHIGPGISPWLPYQARQRCWRSDMGRGLIPGTIWKISCHNLLITYLHWPFPSIDFYIAKKIFELTNCENKSLRELSLFNFESGYVTEYGTALTTILPILFLYLNTVTVTAGTFEP